MTFVKKQEEFHFDFFYQRILFSQSPRLRFIMGKSQYARKADNNKKRQDSRKKVGEEAKLKR